MAAFCPGHITERIVQNDQRISWSFPSFDPCHTQTSDIIIAGRVLSAEDMSALLHRHILRRRLLPLCVLCSSKLWWPLTKVTEVRAVSCRSFGSHWQGEALKVTEPCQECVDSTSCCSWCYKKGSFINLCLSFQLSPSDQRQGNTDDARVDAVLNVGLNQSGQ